MFCTLLHLIGSNPQIQKLLPPSIKQSEPARYALQPVKHLLSVESSYEFRKGRNLCFNMSW